MSRLCGTKELIFDAFVEMTGTLGYENVSIRDIAQKVSINPASLYYHFESKGKMLKYAYEYYTEHQFDDRMPVDEMKKLAETADAEKIAAALLYTSAAADVKKNARMTLIAKIIYMRIFQDPLAQAIFAGANKSLAEYIASILKHGVGAGRIDPGLDIETCAELLTGVRQILGIKAFAGAAARPGREELLAALLARLFSGESL
jgi:AcrR family transcriptional regulator